jgi:hypothetical protein
VSVGALGKGAEKLLLLLLGMAVELRVTLLDSVKAWETVSQQD